MNPPRIDVVGTGISTTSYDQVLDALRVPASETCVVLFCNVHSVMTARRDPRLREAVNAAEVRAPDGMPLVWVLRRSGRPQQPRVYGPELMRRAFDDPSIAARPHYLFGTTEATLTRLEDRLAGEGARPNIVGRYAPPFRPMTPKEEADALDDIRTSGADIVWVGLGMPKQELWIHRVRDELPGVTLLGVGAAFDLISGNVPQAPGWVQDRGLEWVYRLAKEPRRLWRRYAINNPLFLLLTARVLLRPVRATRNR